MRPIRALVRRSPAAAVTAAATALLLALPAAAQPVDEPPPAPRVLAYYQTIYETDADGRRYVDPAPLLGAATDVNVGAIHLNDDGSLHVNDITADHPELAPMWADLAALQAAGVRVHAFVGGAAAGTYRNLAEDFDRFYPLLRDFLVEHHLDGVDLDIEEPFPLEDAVHLVETLRADFGPGFAITLTPVAADLAGRTSFSGGFAYADLEAAVGDQIDWYNTQFYCGWGDLRTTAAFEAILANGFTPDRVVAGTVTNPGNCSGWVEPEVLDATLTDLATTYPTLGGVFGWEYFNALGHDGGGRETWFSHVRDVLRAPAAIEPGRLAVEHTAVVAGGSQTAVGSGFVPDEPVTVVVTGPAGRSTTGAVEVTADAAGSFRVTFDVPDEAQPGVYTVSARGAGGVAEAAYTVTAAPAPPPAPEPAPGDPGEDGLLEPGGDPVPEVAAGGGGEPAATAADPSGRLASTGLPVVLALGVATTLLGAGTALLLRRHGASRA